MIFNINAIAQSQQGRLEIYVQNIPHPILTNENPKDCYCCIELLKENLSSTPLITEKDIEHFDWEKQKISLNKTGVRKLFELDFSKTGVYGIPTSIVLNGKPMYSLIIFPIGSSVACDRPYVHLSTRKATFYIHFGAGVGKNELRFGDDPRFNEELKKYVLSRF